MSGKSGSGKKTPNPGWFSKGSSSPNPGGRPTASPTPQPSVFEILVDKTLTVVRDGMPREIGLKEALQHRIYQDALKGKPIAAPSYVPPSRFPPLKVCVRRPRCAPRHRHGAGIRKPSHRRTPSAYRSGYRQLSNA